MSKQLKVFLALLFGLQTQILPSSFQRFPARCRRSPCRSSLWPICSSHEKFWPTSENCLRSQILILISTPLTCDWLGLPMQVPFWCSPESNLSGQLIFHLVVKCTHDMSLALLSCSTFRLQLFSGILHQYTFLSMDLVVAAFPLVLCASAIDFLVQESQSRVWVSLSISLLARKLGRIALPQQVSLCLFNRYCTLHTNLRLLRRYWELINRNNYSKKQFQSYPHRHRSV